MGQNVNLPTTCQAEPEYYAPAPVTNYFADIRTFEDGQRMSKLLCSSDLVPQQFRGNIANTMIALEMSSRTGSSPFMIMQNIYIVHGKPAWSATFIIAALNSCGRFSPLRFDMRGEGDKRECVAWVLEKGTGERLEGPPVSIEMAKREGWATKNGSKWQTMPELMLRYRAATFFGRLYAPDILMGMRTSDELYDIEANNEAQRQRQPKRNRQPEQSAQVVEAVVVESEGGPSGVEEINAMLKGDAAQKPAQEEAGEAEAGRSEESAPPEYHAMMGYIAEINAIDDPEALKRWWQGQDYKKLTDELGGMNSEFHQAVAEQVQGRIRELEGDGKPDDGKLPPALTKYLESKQQ